LITSSQITACLKKEHGAHKEIYEQCLPYILTIVRRYGYASHQEPDIIQEIFIALFSNLNKYDADKGDFKPWMRSITVYTILKDLRKKKLRFTESLDTIVNTVYDRLDLAHQDTEYIINEIAKLSPGYRTVFNLYAIDGYSHKEIGDLLSISVQTSKSQLSRARSILRKKLSKHYAMTSL